MMELCANCKSRAEAGAVRCINCGAELTLPGSFVQIVGGVVVGISAIPLSMSLSTVPEGEYLPLILGILLFVAGCTMILVGRARNRLADPRVIRYESEEDAQSTSSKNTSSAASNQ